MSTDPRPLPVTYAAIVLKGEHLDPDLVSAIMEREPTLSYRRGDTYSVKGREQERRFGLWVYSTRNIVASGSLKKHLEALEIAILGLRSAWSEKRWLKMKALVEDQGVELRIDVFWYGPAQSEFPHISLSFQHLIDEAGGSIQTDFHRDEDATQVA
ncbi:hypothetical protein JCM2811A_33860 [Methylorubrum rhodinum]